MSFFSDLAAELEERGIPRDRWDKVDRLIKINGAKIRFSHNRIKNDCGLSSQEIGVVREAIQAAR